MRFNSSLFGLPASLILLIASHANANSAIEPNQSPNPRRSNPPSSFQVSAVDILEPEVRSKQNVVGQSTAPVGVLKMSDDPGEKFFHEYWQYEDALAASITPENTASEPLRKRDLKEEVRLLANASTAISWRPPFALHTDDQLAYQDLRLRSSIPNSDGAVALAALQKRDFTCPAGTSSCSSIGAPNACCATDEFCFTVTDTGLGTVGCCPSGSTCGGTISSCNSPNTPCANGGTGYSPGGCCIPNYVCSGVGCVINPSLVVTVIVSQTISVSTQSTTTTAPTTTSVITTSDLQTTSVCSTSWHACAASFGGGCCEDGYTCAPSRSCTISSTTTSGTGVAPVRPTDTDSSITTATSSGSTTCPTGFYACSAYYEGGCCRHGRDCLPTSCAPASSTTILSGGVTVVVPVGTAASVATPTGACATGWSSCDASLGGNCCPTGFACGTASCSSLSPTQTSVVQKASPNSGNRRILGIEGVLVGLIAGCLLI